MGPDFLHLLPDVRRFRFEVVERKQFAQLHLGGIRPNLRGAIVVEDVGETRVPVDRGNRGRIKGRRVLPVAVVVAQVIAARWIDKVGIPGIAAVHPRTAVVHHNVVDDQDAAFLCFADEALQVLQRSETRIDVVEIRRGIRVIVEVPVAVFQHRGEPNGRGSERLDIVQLALDPDPIATVGPVADRGVSTAVDVVVGRVPVEKPVGDDLVNVLVAPKVRIRCGREVRVPREQNAVDVQPSIPHPNVQRVGSRRRNRDAHRG